MLSEISQAEKDKYSILSLICGNLKNKTNEGRKKLNRLRYREQNSGYQWGEGRGARYGYGIKRYKLLCIK